VVKKAAIRRRAEYEVVYSRGRSWADPAIVLRAIRNGTPETRCGLSVGKNLGKAVVRNKVRRRLREILRLASLKEGWDLVLVARAPSVQRDYSQLRQAVEKLLSRASIICEEHENLSPGSN
jgi:ribonuclease P protein component